MSITKITTRHIYAGCGCDVVEGFEDYCPECRITKLESTLSQILAMATDALVSNDALGQRVRALLLLEKRNG